MTSVREQQGLAQARGARAVAGVAARLEELLPADVLDEVLAGLAPEEITGAGG